MPCGALRRLSEKKGRADLPKGFIHGGEKSEEQLPRLYHEKTKKKGRSQEQSLDIVELAELQQTQHFYKSNLFKLEIEQLLKEATIDYTKLSPLENFLKLLKAQIDKLETIDIGNEFEQQYPFLQFIKTPQQRLSLGFKFQAPSRTDLVGSYLLKTVTRPHLNIDIAVEMPSSMFGDKDHRNYRYFNKRSAYVAEMYRQLRRLHPHCEKEENKQSLADRTQSAKKNEVGLVFESELQQFRPYFFLQAWQGDIRRPIIVIKCLIPKGGDLEQNVPIEKQYKMTSWTIRIFPVPPPKTFPERRLGAIKNSVRFCTTSATPDFLVEEFEKQKHAEECLPPTPMYNGAILDDIRYSLKNESLYFPSSFF